jgi:integrase
MKLTRNRYQQGSLTIENRKNGQKIWVYRWRETGPEGYAVRRKRIVRSKTEHPTKSAAMKAVAGLRLDINVETVSSSPITVDQIISHYKEAELADSKRKNTAH